MKIVYATSFLKSARRLPTKIQVKLDSQTAFLAKNIYHPLLHTKQLSGNLSGYYSFRITRDYRVIFSLLDPETAQLLRASHRREIYR